MAFLSRHLSCKCIAKVVNPGNTCCSMIQEKGLSRALSFVKIFSLEIASKQNAIFLKEFAPDNALMSQSLE